jgi:ketosteroid isomerase-like protein
MGSLVGRFMEALQEAERRRDPRPLVSLFGPDATLWSPRREGRGQEGALRFWHDYFAAFRDVRSEFVAVTESDGFAALEWRSTGHLADGAPVSYRGVSLIESADERVRAFRTYFDTAPFGRHPHA